MFSKEYRLKNDIYIFYHLHDTRVKVQKSTGETGIRGSSSVFSNHKAQVYAVAQWTMLSRTNTIPVTVECKRNKIFSPKKKGKKKKKRKKKK